eukprot:jgi/Hompol1/5172/HPOL_004200-RA
MLTAGDSHSEGSAEAIHTHAGSAAVDHGEISEMYAKLLHKLRSGETETALKSLAQTLRDTAARRQRVVAEVQEVIQGLERQKDLSESKAGMSDRAQQTAAHQETMRTMDRTLLNNTRSLSQLQQAIETQEAKLAALESELSELTRNESRLDDVVNKDSVTLAIFQSLGVNLRRNDETLEFIEAITSSRPGNDLEVVDLKSGHTQFYYTDLIWKLCDETLL